MYRRLLEEETLTSEPEKFGGTYAQFSFKTADPASSQFQSKQVSFADVYDTTKATYKNMDTTATNDYLLNTTKSYLECSDNGGCMIHFHFMREFANTDVPIEPAILNQYDFYGFYDMKDDRAFSKPYRLALGAFYGLAASSVAVAAALLMITV